MKRTSLVALLALTLSSAGCTSLCRRTPAPVAQACIPMCPQPCPQVCPPGTVPVGGQGVTYGMPMMYDQ
jgi:hypothetical protein